MYHVGICITTVQNLSGCRLFMNEEKILQNKFIEN